MANLDVLQSGSDVIEAFRKVLTKRIGSIYVSGNATPTTIAGMQTFYPVTLSSTTIESEGFSCSNGRITLTAAAGKYLVQGNMCIAMADQNTEVHARIGLNGAELARSCSHVTIVGNVGSGRKESLALHTIVDMATNDYIEMMVGNWVDTESITVVNMQLSVIEL